MAMLSWLDTKPSLEVAVMLVTWTAIFLLGVMAASLHYRLQRLEHASRLLRSAAPYGHLVGRQVWPPERTREAGITPEAVVLLSSHCRACQTIIDELRDGSPGRSVAIAWKDNQYPDDELPSWVTIVSDGTDFINDLGVGVTPFALQLDAKGFVRSAMPIGSLRALDLEGSKTAALTG